MSVARLLLLIPLCVAAASNAVAGSVSVPMDDVALVSFKSPVSTVYIGNPGIAELTVIDSQHVFVLGKRFGATNLIALNAEKKLVENDLITVSAQHAAAITVFRGPETYNYVCTSFHCETRPVPGDPATYFGNVEQEATTHVDAATKSAGAGASQSSMH